MPERTRPQWQEAVRWLTAFVFTVVVAATLFANRANAAGADAVFSQNLVNRALRFGGSYYQNGIHPKGPLEEVAHDLARRIGGFDGHFYVISVMVAISGLIIGAAAVRTTRATGGSRYMALAVGAVVFLHFTVSGAGYSGILYSRNIFVTLLAIAWILVLDDRGWMAGRRIRYTVAAGTGVLLGLAVQTILPGFIDAAAIGVAALVLMARRVDDVALRRRLRWTTCIAAIGGFVSAPVWYLMRGSFPEFWASWFTYARDQNVGLGLSTGQQLARAWHNFYPYYQHRPIVFLLIAGFVAFTVSAWPRLDSYVRIVHVTLAFWFLGGWFELTTGARYLPHYFSVIAAPTAMMGAALAGHLSAALEESPRVRRSAVAWPLLAMIGAIYLSAPTAHDLVDSAAFISDFTSVGRNAAIIRGNQPGPDKSVQAVLDLVSRDLDPLLVYSDEPRIYTGFRRIPATRFQQRYFLIGSIYLGQQSKRFVLNGTWHDFDSDLRQSNPAAFLETQDIDSPQFAAYVAGHFETAYTGKSGSVHLRDDIAASVLQGPAPTPWTAPQAPTSDQHWTVHGNDASYSGTAEPSGTDRLVLATSSCQRIEGTIVSRTKPPGVVFHLEDTTTKHPEVRIALDGETAASKDANDGVFESGPSGVRGNAPASFALVMGTRSAVLVVGDKIVAAVALPERKDPQLTKVTVEALHNPTALHDLRVGPPPIGSDC